MASKFSTFNLFCIKYKILNTNIHTVYIKYKVKTYLVLLLFANHPNTEKTLSHLALWGVIKSIFRANFCM